LPECRHVPHDLADGFALIQRVYGSSKKGWRTKRTAYGNEEE